MWSQVTKSFFVFFLAGIAIVLLTCTCAASDYSYEFRGRVVDEHKNPIPNASVRITPSWGDGHIVTVGGGGADGRFVIKKENFTRRPPYWTVFVVDADRLPANADAMPSIGDALSYDSNRNFQGIRVTAKPGIVDLGDLVVQYRLWPVLVKFYDVSENPLIIEREDRYKGFDPWWTVRDTLGNVVSEGTCRFDSFRFGDSAIIVGLPAGSWDIEISDSNGSNLAISSTFFITESKPVQSFSLHLEPTTFRFTGVKPFSSQMRKPALDEIRKLGYVFDKKTFKRLVWNGNHRVVELFLKAGMSPNSSDGTGDFLASAAASHPRMLKLLLEAGADVDRKVRYGLTPLVGSVGSTMSIDSIRMLLDAGADPNIKDNRGRNAFDMVENNREMLQLLEQYRLKNNKKTN